MDVVSLDDTFQIKDLTETIESREEKLKKKERQIANARVRSFLRTCLLWLNFNVRTTGSLHSENW